MSLDDKIRKIQAQPHMDQLKEVCREHSAECAVRTAEIRLVEDLLDKIDAAVAAGDYGLAGQLVEECLAAYASVKSTSAEEVVKMLQLAEIVAKFKGDSFS